MNIKNIFSVIAGLIAVIAFFPYILAIFGKGIVLFQKKKKRMVSIIPKKKTKPIKATWIIWAVLDTIILAGMIAKEAINGQILACVGCAWILVVFSMKHGRPGWSRVDKFCLSGAAIGIFLWALFGDPFLGLVISLIVLFLGSIPTFISAWEDPSREDQLAWTMFWISCVFAIIAIPKWTFQDAGQPITFFLIESIMVYILYVHARKFSKKKALSS